MAKKSTPVEKAARMLDLVPFITTHQGIPLDDLAAQFQVSQSELLSDLNALWMCGDSRFDLIDLEFESGFVSIRNAETLSLVRSLSPQEIISILIGLDLIGHNLDPERQDLMTEIAELRSKVGLDIGRSFEAIPSLSSTIVELLTQAITQRRSVEFAYHSISEDRVSIRCVDPIHISEAGGFYFLQAFCQSANSHRTFRVDRMSQMKILEAQTTSFAESDSEPITLAVAITLLRDKRYSRESLGQSVTGNESEVEVSIFNGAWLSRTVIGAAGAMKVTSPAQSCDEIASRAGQILDLYR